MAKKKTVVPEVIVENVQDSPMDDIMGERFATYAKYVIQDRAIPDIRDGLKPVQRRIIFAMYESGNLSTKPTRKCAHTVGEVMGNYHPHGDSSIYFAMARMSQEWKVRVPLIDFQGNNGSIDGDTPAAYRYTEARLSEAADEMIRDIDEDTVDMQLTFDDTKMEPVVLPSRFPNLLVNGSEGIAVAVATDIPPHNLKEVIDATIHRIQHPNCTMESLLQILPGPDFPTGGKIYRSEGLTSIYTTGKGRIEIEAKTRIVEGDGLKQIIIDEIPYGILKSDLVYEIDKIVHEKTVDGLLEVRDESDRQGLRIAIDLKKDAREDVILNYLLSKTKMRTSFTANMVTIIHNRPKTCTLFDFLDAYILHQQEVIQRRSKFRLAKKKARLNVVDGLIHAVSIIDDVVHCIKASKDKADSKVNLCARFGFNMEQAEAIVTMPLYKLSNTDITVLQNEKKQLEKDIASLNLILSDEKVLNKLIIDDLRSIAKKYGDERRSQIVDFKEEVVIDKRDLIAKEDVMVAVTKDGYIKRSSLKSYNSSNGALPGIKYGDTFIGWGMCSTVDYLLAFTNFGNYILLPVHEILEGKWKDEGKHINYLVKMAGEEKLVSVFCVDSFSDKVCVACVSKNGQIVRTRLSGFFTQRCSRPIGAMKLTKHDELVSAMLLTGDNSILILTKNGNATYFNEAQVPEYKLKAGGVKAVSSLKQDEVVAAFAYSPEEKGKLILVTDRGYQKVFDTSHLEVTARLGRLQSTFKCFKSDRHGLVYAVKCGKGKEKETLYLLTNNKDLLVAEVSDFRPVSGDKYAKANISLKKDEIIVDGYKDGIFKFDKNTKTYQTKEIRRIEIKKDTSSDEKQEDEDGVEQISIFDDFGD